MKTQAYQILYSVYGLLQQSPSTVPAADLIATALELDPEDAAPAAEPAAEPVSREALRNAAPADPCPATPAAEPPAALNRREKLIRQIQAIIDEAHSDDVTIALQRIKSAGIPMGAIADLLGVNIHVVYNTSRGKNKGGEQKFWKTFAKPNITPKEETK